MFESNVEHGFFNIGTGNSISLNELASLMIKISGKPLQVQYNDPLDGDIKLSKADISLATRTFDWKPQTPFEEGLRTLF